MPRFALPRRTARRRLAAALAALVAAPAAARAEGLRADVVAVEARGAPGAYLLAVSVKSPDRDCHQYANWWEVVGEDGKLLFRRVLMHSHPEEQPFTRPGGPVPIAADTTVIVRAHLVPGGYVGTAMRGSVAHGFAPWTSAPLGFAAALEKQEPLPKECWR